MSIGKDFNWLYDTVTMDDKKAFKMICDGKTEAIFQLEKPGMTSFAKRVVPDNIEDLSAILALWRPGPIGAGSPEQFIEWRKDASKREELLPGIDKIMDRTFGVVTYQEQLMAISKKVAGFDDGQADSITRKITAKKKVEMMPMMRRCHIYGKKNCEGPEGWENDNNAPWYDPKGKYGKEIPGAISNGYTAEQIDGYFEKIRKFSEYAFNQSHTACYAFISVLCAYLKSHYPAQFMSAAISMAQTDDKKEDLIKACEDLGIRITPPDANLSKEGFTATSDKTLSYGLSSIKGIKQTADIIANAPYKDLKDAYERIPKKSFNKKVAEGLIKAGAFDFSNKNRKELLNEYITLSNQGKTKSQQRELLENTTYDKMDCMQMEVETLGRSITYEPAWKGALAGERLSGNCTLKNIKHHITKSTKKRMAMLTVINETYAIEALLFPKEYPKYVNLLNNYEDGQLVYIEGAMDKEGKKLIINSISAPQIENQEPEKAVNNTGMPVFNFDPFDFNAA